MKKYLRTTLPPAESKYARKLRLREGGVSEPIKTSKSVRPSSEVEPSTDQSKWTVEATVVGFITGAFFLKADGSQHIFMGRRHVRKIPLSIMLREGTKIKCEIEPHPEGRGKRVKQVIQIIAA